MNLFFKSESIGFIAVPYWGLQTKTQLMTWKILLKIFYP